MPMERTLVCNTIVRGRSIYEKAFNNPETFKCYINAQITLIIQVDTKRLCYEVIQNQMKNFFRIRKDELIGRRWVRFTAIKIVVNF